MNYHTKRGRKVTYKEYENTTEETAPWPESDVFTDDYNSSNNE